MCASLSFKCTCEKIYYCSAKCCYMRINVLIWASSYSQRKGLQGLVTLFQMGDFYYAYMDLSHFALKFFATHVLYLLRFLVNQGKYPCDYFTEAFYQQHICSAFT